MIIRLKLGARVCVCVCVFAVCIIYSRFFVEYSFSACVFGTCPLALAHTRDDDDDYDDAVAHYYIFRYRLLNT